MSCALSVMKEVRIYMRSQHLFTRKQEKSFKDTMKFKPKQRSTDIKSKETEAADRLPARNEKTWVPAEQQLTVIGVSGSYRQGWSRCPKDRLARMPEGKSHKFIPRERFSQSHLGDC